MGAPLHRYVDRLGWATTLLPGLGLRVFRQAG